MRPMFEFLKKLSDWYNIYEGPWKEIFGGGSQDSYFFFLTSVRNRQMDRWLDRNINR